MAGHKDLSDIRNHLYDKVEFLWWLTFWIALATQVLVLVAVWIANQKFLLLVGVIALLSPITISWIREYAATIFNKADKCRRLILYGDGIDRHISHGELAEVQSFAVNSQLAQAPFLKPYYSSKLPVGPNRLADIVAESSFFTKNLSGYVVLSLWKIWSLSALLLVGILMCGDLFAEQTVLLGVSKSVSIVIAFLISGDFALLIKKYMNLRDSAKETFSACDHLREKIGLTYAEVFLPVENYNLALAQSPPIPSRYHLKYLDELNVAYRCAHCEEDE